MRDVRQTLQDSSALLYSGSTFQAHEVFEDAWKSAPEEHREFWRGLAQLAVGLTHRARGNEVGAQRLVTRARAVLAAPTTTAPAGLDATSLVTCIDGLGQTPDAFGQASQLASCLRAMLQVYPDDPAVGGPTG